MKIADTMTFSIDNFQGPLDLLWQLITQQEIDIYEISLQQITEQFIQKFKQIQSQGIDTGAEFIATAAALIWLKSKTLLPIHEQQVDTTPEEEDPNFEIIHHLMDYCRFKHAAKELTNREQFQSIFYTRGVESEIEAKKNLGIEHISLDELAALFREVIAKASSSKGIIHEEIWRVSDKIKSLRYLIHEQGNISFNVVFCSDKSREELIVTFLALLELMKLGEAKVIHDKQKNMICIVGNS